MNDALLLLALSFSTALIVFFDLVIIRTSINPVRLMGYVFILFAIITPPLWEALKGLPGSGVPPSLDYGSRRFFEIASLTTAGGLLLTSLLFHFFTPDKSKALIKFSFNNFQKFPPIFSVLLIILWILGQGPSLLERSGYLASDGISFLLRPTALLGPILAVAIFTAEIATKKSVSKLSFLLLISWMLLLAGVSSRLAILPALLISISFLVIVLRNIKEPISKVGFWIIWLYATSWAVLLLFFVSLAGRSGAHGLQNLPSLVFSDSAPKLWVGEEWLTTLQTMVVSVVSIYPITNISASSPIDPRIIWLNANPLPSELLGLNADNSSELILPWLPKSLLGEMLGTFGIGGLFFAVILVASIALAALRYASTRGQNLIVLVISVSFVLALLSALQYPSRVSLRFFSTIYFAAGLVWILGLRDRFSTNVPKKQNQVNFE